MSVSRRSVAKGAAWSVPAVAMASAAPAYAASPTLCPTIYAGGCFGYLADGCNSTTYYPWVGVTLTRQSNDTFDLGFNNSYGVVTGSASNSGTFTLTETITFPAGWGPYLNTTVAANGQYASISVSNVSFDKSSYSATDTSATISWTMTRQATSGCACYGVQWAFQDIPYTKLNADKKTDSTVTYSSATLAGVGNNCVAASSKSVTLKIDKGGTDEFNQAVPRLDPASTLLCNNGISGVNSGSSTARSGANCGA